MILDTRETPETDPVGPQSRRRSPTMSSHTVTLTVMVRSHAENSKVDRQRRKGAGLLGVAERDVPVGRRIPHQLRGWGDMFGALMRAW